MQRFRSFISTLLVIVMILTIQTITADDVNAAKKKFTNVKFENNVLTWDPIENLADDVYKITVEKKSDNFKKTYNYGMNIFDMDAHYQRTIRETYHFDNSYLLKSGPVKITLSAKDKKGNSYKWSDEVEYVDRIVHKVGTIKWEGDYLTWEHDRYNIPPEEELNYVLTVYVDPTDGPDQYAFKYYTADTSFPTNEIAVAGSHNYYISVNPMAKTYYCMNRNCPNSTEITREFGGSSVLTGVNIKDGILQWNPYPEADSYLLNYCYSVPNQWDENRSTEKITGTTKDLLTQFYNVGAEDNLVDVKIAACKGDVQLTPFTDIHYIVDTSLVTYYPLYVFGTQLDMYNFDVLPGWQSKYDPASKTLTISPLSKWGFHKPTAFYSTEDLTVCGHYKPDLITQGGTAFDCDKTLTFANDFKTKATTEKTVIHAKNIVFNKGELYLKSGYEDGIIADNDITINHGCVLETVVAEGKNAISAGGKIKLNGSKIVIPQGGKLDKSGHTILNPDGTVASHIRIEPAEATPTSTPSAKPTAKVTASPTAKVTSQVTKAPAKPTSGASSKPDDPQKSISAFVERIYIYVLDREPEAEGAAFWSEELYSFRRTGAEVAQGFIFSPEFESRDTTDEEFVTILYKTFFGRDPEDEGMAFWLSQLSSGTMDRVTVANGFIYSQEWADTCASYGIRSGGDLKPTGAIAPTDLTYAFVERMYTTCLGRGYDEEGRQYWASVLANFETTGEIVGASFFLSDEMTSYALSDEDFLNRLYLTFMDREADADGSAYWLGVMASGTPRSDVVFGFTRSPEFTEKCIEARILPY